MKLNTLRYVGIALLTAALVTPAARAVAGAANEQPPPVQPAGAPTSPGASLVAATLAAYATVDGNGVLNTAQSKNITSAKLLNLTGGFEVDTALSSVAHCTYAVSSGLAGNTKIPLPIFAGATGRSGTINNVFVQTYDSSHTATPEPFMLQIFC